MRRIRTEYQRAYYATHRKRIRDQQRDWYAAHAAEERQRSLAHYAANREKRRVQVAAWHLAHPTWRNEWRAANRDKDREYVKRRRARKFGNGGSHIADEFHSLCSGNGWRCWYCGSRSVLTEDHMVPLARGGTDDISNILPACRACNGSKGARTAEEFLALRGAA